MARTPSSGTATSLRLCLLGAFRIERDARLIALPARKKLAALFWGDSTDEQARHSLRTALATLRSKLGDDILLAGGNWSEARALKRARLCFEKLMMPGALPS